jgi:hypothetical protein
MEMPKSCEQCKMFNLVKSINDFRCCANDEWHEADFDYHNKRHHDCPIVEIPTPHGRLIDADRLLKVLSKNSIISKITYANGDSIEDIIRKAPTIIEAEVSE